MEYSGYVTVKGFPLKAYTDKNDVTRVAQNELLAVVGKPSSGVKHFKDIIFQYMKKPGESKCGRTGMVGLDEAIEWVRTKEAVPITIVNKLLGRKRSDYDINLNKVILPPLTSGNYSDESPTDSDTVDEIDEPLRNNKRKIEGEINGHKRIKGERKTDGTRDIEYDANYKGVDIRYVIFDGKVYLRFEDICRRLKKKGVVLKRPKRISIKGSPPTFFIDREEFRSLIEEPGINLPSVDCLDLAREALV